MYAATVHAAASGTVTFAGETPGYGKTVVVTHRFPGVLFTFPSQYYALSVTK